MSSDERLTVELEAKPLPDIVGVFIRRDDGHRIAISGDEPVKCTDRFHGTGEGGTVPEGGQWQLTHCAVAGCDGTEALHKVLAE